MNDEALRCLLGRIEVYRRVVEVARDITYTPVTPKMIEDLRAAVRKLDGNTVTCSACGATAGRRSADLDDGCRVCNPDSKLCPTCRGESAEEGVNCPTCHGTGRRK